MLSIVHGLRFNLLFGWLASSGIHGMEWIGNLVLGDGGSDNAQVFGLATILDFKLKLGELYTVKLLRRRSKTHF